MNKFAVLCIFFGHACGAVYIYFGMPMEAIYYGLFALTYMLMLLKTN
jgi:hypothetical protein